MHNFNWIDITIFGLLFASLVAGLMRGLIKEVVALLSWLAAFFLATVLSGPFAQTFTSTSKAQSTMDTASANLGVNTAEPASLLAIGICFFIIFIFVLIVGKIVGYLVTGAIEGRGISFSNRFLGGLFGLARGFLFVLLVLFLVQLSPASEEPIWKNSQFVKNLKPVTKWISEKVQPNINELKAKVEQAWKKASKGTLQSVTNNLQVFNLDRS